MRCPDVTCVSLKIGTTPKTLNHSINKDTIIVVLRPKVKETKSRTTHTEPSPWGHSKAADEASIIKTGLPQAV